MTVNYTTNLSLGQPVTGTESGTWGDDVNNAITSYLDIAIAGSLALTSASFTANALTIANTQGTSSATNIGSTTAQYYVLRLSSLAANVTITAPSVSKTYLVVNADATYAVTIKASGQTGTSVAAGERAMIYFNGTDYIKVTSSVVSNLVGVLPVANGGTGVTTSTGTGAVVLGTSPTIATATFTGANTIQGLTVGLGASAVATNTAVGVTAFSSNTSGTNNTVVGNQAGVGNTTGLYNTAIGDASLYANTTGSGNTVVGQGAMYTGSGGSYNTGIGYSAGNANASYNTSIGYSAGSGSYGSTNTYLGKNSGSGMTSGSNNVIIGSFTGFGAPIFGTNDSWIVLSDGAGLVRQAIDPAGNAQFFSGALVVYAPAPTTTISAVTTLTNAQIQGQLIVTSGTAFTLTMPTATTLLTLVTWGASNTGYDFSVINTASGTITMAVNTGVTSVGTLTVLTGISARFRIRNAGSSTFVLYRIS